AQTVRRLAEQYGTIIDIDELLSRFVDIHKRIVDAVTLPIESYALKHIARWIGFEWRDSEANGAQSICWYNEWLTTGDRTYLDAILRYNEDDCRATYYVKRWLAEFAKPYWQTAAPSYLTASA
ncbi:MAG: TM0106 family RecB-like putative nuclease, partial [Cyanobacteria bacterium J06626_18]